MDSASLLPLLRSQQVLPTASRRSLTYLLVVALLLIASPLIFAQSHRQSAAADAAGGSGHPATTSKRLFRGEIADAAIVAAQFRGRRLAASAPAPKVTLERLQLAPQTAAAPDADAEGGKWGRSDEKMEEFVAAHVVFEKAAEEALPPSESALAEADSADGAAAIDAPAAAAADAAASRPLAPAEQQHVAATELLKAVAAAVTRAGGAPANAATRGAQADPMQADSEEAKAAEAMPADHSDTRAVAALVVDTVEPAAAAPAAAPAAESDLTAGALADCMAAGEANRGGAPFTVQDFADGKPARLVLEMEYASAKPPAFDATAVTALSLARLDRLDGLCASWGGPLVAAVYVAEIGAAALPPLAAEDAWMDQLQAEWDADAAEAGEGEEVEPPMPAAESPLAAARREVRAAFDRIDAAAGGCQLSLTLYSELVAGSAEATLFPFNALRNAAALRARTQLLLIVDGDMLVSSSLSAELASPVGFTKMRALARARRAIIIPAFQTSQGADAVAAGGKAAVLAALAASNLTRFAPECKACHDATGYGRWAAAADNSLPYATNYTTGYEPYVLGARALLPPFDERYRGYGLDKVSWARYLQHAGFKFAVHPTAFMVHRPHAPTAARAAWSIGNGMPAPMAEDNIDPKVITKTAYKMFGAMEWHLNRGSYQPVTSHAYVSCRAELPWWRIFPAGGISSVTAMLGPQQE